MPDFFPDDTRQSNALPPEVPDFDLIRSIGEGGFGRVWLATNRTTGRLRAVKLIPLGSSGPASLARREIVSLTQLEAHVGNLHPNLMGIQHVGRTTQYLFYVMDLADDVSGAAASSLPTYEPATLDRRLRAGPLPPQQCLSNARQLLAGLASLHAAGVIHRDVKPANCLFVAGQLRLADFGLLTEVDRQISRLGTTKYMPPDGRMDARADVYAAGLVIYEMLTGLPPDSYPRLGARAHATAEDRTLRMLNRLMLGACQPDPQHRFADAREMLAQLERLERQTPPHRLRRRPFVLAAATMAAILGASLYWFWPVPKVDANFITDPYEATVLLNDQPWLDPQGNPYTTPCTIPDLPARTYRVGFHHRELGEFRAGEVDFSQVREVTARWPSAP